MGHGLGPIGVAGAGLASSLAVGVGVVLMAMYFHRLEKYVAFDVGAWRPQLAIWGRLLRIGLPAGGEFALMFMYLVVIYGLIRPLRPRRSGGISASVSGSCKACFCPRWRWRSPPRPSWGRILRPGKYLARTRNLPARDADRQLHHGRRSPIFCHLGGALAVRAFTANPAVISVGTQFLLVISWNFLASGIVFTCSAVFQGLGHTMPAVLSAASRLVSFVVPALWLASSPQFQLVQLWYVSVASVTLQALFSLWLVRREFQKRLPIASPIGGGISDTQELRRLFRMGGRGLDTGRLRAAFFRQDPGALAGVSMDEYRGRRRIHHQLQCERRVAVGGPEYRMAGDWFLRLAAQRLVTRLEFGHHLRERQVLGLE
jgi:hypothetical protein